MTLRLNPVTGFGYTLIHVYSDGQALKPSTMMIRYCYLDRHFNTVANGLCLVHVTQNMIKPLTRHSVDPAVSNLNKTGTFGSLLYIALGCSLYLNYLLGGL